MENSDAPLSVPNDGVSSWSPPRHPHEAERLDSVRAFDPFARRDDPALRSVACQAAEACGAPIGMVTLMEERHERVVACVGLPMRRLDRRLSICAHTILERDALVVEDLRLDARFRDLPYVAGEPFARFYAGAPIRDATDLPVGSVCVVDVEPRAASSLCRVDLRSLADVVSAVLETRRLFAQVRSPGGAAEAAGEDRAFLDERLLALVVPRAMGRMPQE